MSDYHGSNCLNFNSYETYNTSIHVPPLSCSRHLASLFCPLGSAWYSLLSVQSTEVSHLPCFSELYFYSNPEVDDSSPLPLSLYNQLFCRYLQFGFKELTS